MKSNGAPIQTREEAERGKTRKQLGELDASFSRPEKKEREGKEGGHNDISGREVISWSGERASTKERRRRRRR